MYKSVVVGGGPAGLAAVGTLLDNQLFPILWVDPKFNGGRLTNYLSVPSNTKVSLFERFAKAPASFQAALKRNQNTGITMFEGWDADAGCPLALARDMVKEMTRLVLHDYSDKVTAIHGYTHKITPIKSGSWSVHIGENPPSRHSCPNSALKSFQTERIILATGSHPKDRVPLHPNLKPESELDLDTALNPRSLIKIIKPHHKVLVVGSSHSAILVLKNLAELPTPPAQIHNVWKDALLYAEYMPDDWILYDNTGLKGLAAQWAKYRLEPGLVPNLVRFSCNDKTFLGEQERHYDFVIHAVGFDRNPLPDIYETSLTEHPYPQSSITHDPRTAALLQSGKPLPNVWGFGIAFPEKTTDPRGNVEDSVGLWKFMKYITRIAPTMIIKSTSTTISNNGISKL